MTIWDTYQEPIKKKKKEKIFKSLLGTEEALNNCERGG